MNTIIGSAIIYVVQLVDNMIFTKVLIEKVSCIYLVGLLWILYYYTIYYILCLYFLCISGMYLLGYRIDQKHIFYLALIDYTAFILILCKGLK